MEGRLEGLEDWKAWEVRVRVDFVFARRMFIGPGLNVAGWDYGPNAEIRMRSLWTECGKTDAKPVGRMRKPDAEPLRIMRFDLMFVVRCLG